ncbi:MiaB/RimO family radical SAM methylthiotransferase [Synechococcus sp. Cruz CV-v-12]|uniref:MiaB/RimO family radical SAM methylthiotransferase n=1 Tax=Synechococcus sp. Cruz CV-v-12 TaxID=2823728 RepID=UPI0028F41F21|nr:MiaB/RimO family radical SAM methylthiotransferase [Synechococcus sp. Cruz CV-v-12]MCP9874699.1 radical SAM protein [Synechococcus sp. Cruz CV-v-12]
MNAPLSFAFMLRPTVYLETFGCQMNELDSELVVGSLRAMGYSFTPDASAAGVVLYNTCSVREHAEQKVWSRLGELAIRKLEQPGLVVGVLGCMAEREGAALIKRMPVVDIMVGPAELDKLPSLLDNAVRTRASIVADEADAAVARLTSPMLASEERKLRSADQVALQGATSRRTTTLAAAADQLEMLDLSRAVSPDDHSGSAYVRITRGCNKFCTYCVVPHTRGAEVHRPPEHIIDECKRLADAGVLEVTLLGQTVNHYRFEHGSAVTIGGVIQPQKGRVYKKTADHADAYAGERVTTFADLLHQIHERVPAIKRLRFVTSYPRSFGNDVLSVIKASPRICRYLHVPAQSGSDRMLTAMNRGYTVEEYFEFLDRARAFLHEPEISRPLTVAGDIIVGFPGETEEDHQATAALLRRARYKNCFIFKYSSRPGTVADDKLPDDIPDEVKRRRNSELLALQNEISAEISAEYAGTTVDAFVQGVSRRDEKKARRTGAAAPGATKATPSGAITLTIGGRAMGVSGAEDEAPSTCTVDASHIHNPVLTNDPANHHADEHAETVQLSARTDGDLIVFFDAPAPAATALIGRIVRVRIDRTTNLALHGQTV